MKQKINTVIIAPYFEDVAVSEFCAEVSRSLGQADLLIIVDDGSVDRPFEICDFENNGINGTCITLTRNVGHQLAIHTGLSYAVQNFDFDTAVVLDSDGEDRPQDIADVIDKLSHENIDVVVASRKSRVESLSFKLFYFLYMTLFKLLVGKVIGFGNFMAMGQSAAKRLITSAETRLHLAASVINSRLRVYKLPLDRGARYAGSSKMNLVSLTLHGLRSVMVFSDHVLVRITLFCVFFAIIIILAMIAMTFFKLTGSAVPGWYSTGGGILILLLFQSGFVTLILLLLSGNSKNQAVTENDFEQIILRVETHKV